MNWKALSTKVANILELLLIVGYKLLLLYALFYIGTELHNIANLIGYAIGGK